MKTFVIPIALLALSLPATAQDAPPVDPRARAVLTEMVAAYRKLRTLDQETTYAASGSELGRLIKSRLAIQRPNRLLYEITERAPTHPMPVVRRYQCDGKQFYSFFEAKNWFTVDPAPKNLGGFRNLASNVELAALAGVDPFQSLAQQARSVKLEEPGEADGVPVEIVAIDVGDEDRTGITRFYVGRDDHLLRRFVYDSIPLAKPEPAKKETNAAPPPLDPTEILAESTPPQPIHFEYENRVQAGKNPGKDAFRWVAPTGAMRLNENPLGYLDQTRRRQPGYHLAKPLDLSNATPSSELKPTTKRVFASDLIKRQTKPKKR